MEHYCLTEGMHVGRAVSTTIYVYFLHLLRRLSHVSVHFEGETTDYGIIWTPGVIYT